MGMPTIWSIFGKPGWPTDGDDGIWETESTPPKQVLATVRGLDEDSDSEKTPPNVVVPGSSNQESDPGYGEGVEELTRIAGKNGENITYPEVLTTPITAEEAADPEALEAEAQKVVKAAATVLADKMETDEMMQVVDEQERKTTQYLDKSIELRDSGGR
jgi:hypothetical protein